MKFDIDFTDLHRSGAKINGPDYLLGFDLAMSSKPYCGDTAQQCKNPEMFKKGFHYASRILKELPDERQDC